MLFSALLCASVCAPVCKYLIKAAPTTAAYALVAVRVYTLRAVVDNDGRGDGERTESRKRRGEAGIIPAL